MLSIPEFVAKALFASALPVTEILNQAGMSVIGILDELTVPPEIETECTTPV